MVNAFWLAGAFGGIEREGFQAVLLQQPSQMPSLGVDQPGGLRHIASGALDRAGEKAAFELGERVLLRSAIAPALGFLKGGTCAEQGDSTSGPGESRNA